MQVSATTQPAGSSDADTIALGVFEDDGAPEAAPPRRQRCSAAGEARGAFKSLALAHADGKRWLLVGLGKRERFTPERARVAAAAVRGRARELVDRARCAGSCPRTSPEIAAALVEGTMLADYRFDRHKSAPARGRRTHRRRRSSG